MIGHQLFYQLSKNSAYQVYGTLKKDASHYSNFGLFDHSHVFYNVDALTFETVLDVLNQLKPDVVLNCIGITLRRPEIKTADITVELNGMLPHRVAHWCLKNKSRLLHFSTDCVFDGASGLYDEDSAPSAKDLYGKTKFLGEVTYENCLTLRTPVIGPEIEGKTELVEWFLAQGGKTINGYTQAIYSGITTYRLSVEVQKIIDQFPKLSGRYHISSHPISKYDLLLLLNEYSQIGAKIQKYDNYVANKSLSCQRYMKATGYQIPQWEEMISEMISSAKIQANHHQMKDRPHEK